MPDLIPSSSVLPFYADSYTTLYCGDALAILPMFASASIQLILVDPPYMGVKADTWDNQWPTREAYLAWLRQLAKEWQRILAPNGSLYCFASPQMAAHVEVMLGEMFTVLNTLVWRKHDGTGAGTGGHSKTCKEELRSFFPQTERIIFCEQCNAESMALGERSYAAECERLHGFVFEPIRAYLEGERKRAGIAKAAINEACGFAPIAGAMASRHYFSPSQWCLPTSEHYRAMQALFNAVGRQPPPPFADYHPAGSVFTRFHQVDTSVEFLRVDYEFLRVDYESLRRPFTVSARVPYTDVWDFATVQAGPGKHPCEKPLPLLRHIIEASSRPGETVLDCCAGSGSTLEAARQCGRKSIGIERDLAYITLAASRLRQQWLF